MVEQHDGEVPRDIASNWSRCPAWGARRRTSCSALRYGMATGVVVDTHVTRLSHRLGLTKHTDAVKIEQDLMQLLPEERVGRLRPPHDSPRPADLRRAQAEVPAVFDEFVLPEDWGRNDE